MEEINYKPADKRMSDTIANVINSAVSIHSINAGMDKADIIMELLGRRPLKDDSNISAVAKIGELHLQAPKKASDVYLSLFYVCQILARRIDAAEQILSGRFDMASEKSFQQYLDTLNDEIKKILAL